MGVRRHDSIACGILRKMMEEKEMVYGFSLVGGGRSGEEVEGSRSHCALWGSISRI